ncbi:hypothetical protein BpHYR1_042224 [Brachionus plicatilis]|uniref:Uncharacterized protein n=1 Tax=Brachionus plicatilis TaxID=10195 RepID=A0A3M7SGM8_BRAPC|nr:hypothetical protein BpHYR1_042224 [Brachionus plicatilis]
MFFKGLFAIFFDRGRIKLVNIRDQACRELIPLFVMQAFPSYLEQSALVRNEVLNYNKSYSRKLLSLARAISTK